MHYCLLVLDLTTVQVRDKTTNYKRGRGSEEALSYDGLAHHFGAHQTLWNGSL